MNNTVAANGNTATATAPRVSRYDKLYLGQGPKGVYSMDPTESQVNNNVLVISGTGGGKTVSVVEPNLLHAHNQSLVVLLTKRRLMDNYIPVFRKRGYDVKVLDLVNPDRSNVGYDPLLHVKDDTDIRDMAKHLIAAGGCTSAKEPYWETSGASLLRAFVKLARHKFGKQATMNQMLELFRYINVHEREEWDEDGTIIRVNKFAPAEDFEYYREADPDMYLDWDQYENNAGTTSACIRGILQTALATLAGEDIHRLMDKKPQLQFRPLADRKSVLFILTSPVNTAHHPFANMVLGAMFKELFEYGESLPNLRLPNPVTVICDDFATGGKIPNFHQHISIFREKGIAVMMLVQSISQLESMYGAEEAKTIRDNSDSIVYLGGNDLQTAKEIGERINLPKDIVLSLQIGQEYLFRRGQKPIQLQRYQIFSDPLYKQEIVHSDAVTLR